MNETPRLLRLFVLLPVIFHVTGTLPCNGKPDKKPSVLLVTVDTLRADHLGCYGHPDVYTPALDRFSQQSHLFLDAWTDVPLTLPAHTSLLACRSVMDHGVTQNGVFVDISFTLLPERFKAEGYRTAAFLGGFPLVRRFGLNRGFDRFDDHMDRPVRGSPAERLGETVVDAACKFIRDQPGPVFLWVHLYDPHAPYQPPEPFLQISSEDYSAEVAYADHCLTRLLSCWESRFGVNTLQMILADHGEGLGTHGEITHGVFLYDETVRIPLLIRLPSDLSGAVLNRTATPIYSVGAWIAGALNLNWDGVESAPKPLLYTRYPLDRHGWSPLTACRDGKWKYITGPAPELFNLDSDPGEGNNLVELFPDLVKSLARGIVSPPAADQPNHRAVDAKTADALISLGYAAPLPVTRQGPLPDPKALVSILAPMELGLEAIHLEQWPKAVPLFQSVLETDPDNPVANNNLGLALTRLNQPESAMNAFHRAVAVQPANPQLQNNLGVALRKLRQYEKAVAAFREAVLLDPQFGAAHLNLAITLYLSGSNSASRNALSRALELDPALADLEAARDLVFRLQCDVDKEEK